MSRGFTLVELVIAMLLISILAVTLWPRTPSRGALTLQARAEQLASDIRYAQTLSMTTGQRHCLLFDPISGPPYSGYRLRSGLTCATVVAHPAGLNEPVVLCTSGTCINTGVLPNDYVQFDGLGVPYTDSATRLGATANVTVSDDGTKTVSITAETGRVIVQ